jgi:hypothetical protein
MHPHQQPARALHAQARLSAEPEDEISDEEANAEIDIPGPAPAPATPPRPAAGPAPTDDITPSVRQAIDKAADVLRELRRQP